MAAVGLLPHAFRLGGQAIDAVATRFLSKAVPTAGGAGLGVGIHHATQGNSSTVHYGERKLEVIPPPLRPDSLVQTPSVQPPRTAKVFFQEESLAATLPRDHILWSEQTEGGQGDRRVGEERRKNGPENEPPEDSNYVTLGLVSGAVYGTTKYLVTTPKREQTFGGVVGSGLMHGIAGGLFGWSHLFSFIGVGAYAGSNLVDTFHASKNRAE